MYKNHDNATKNILNLSVIKSPTLKLCLPSSKSRIKENKIHMVHENDYKNVMQIYQVQVRDKIHLFKLSEKTEMFDNTQ